MGDAHGGGRPVHGVGVVRPKLVGQEVVIRLREWSSGGALATDRTGAVKAASTGWRQVSVQVTAFPVGRQPVAFGVREGP